MALTSEQKQALLKEVKAFLNITWQDEHTDTKIMNFINSSISRLNAIAGLDLDYSLTDDTLSKYEKQANQMGKELLLVRCFYLNEKAHDDFEENYKRELLSLSRKGRVINRIKELENHAP